ncbi:MAG: HDOD domain-containing protein [Planctomycetes bacterium]|nr:HDOD domain-containing protein [Planctomycetota bacterium]
MTPPEFPSIDLHSLLTADQLPAMPQSAISLLSVSQDPTAGPAEFAIPIEADPGLTVQVLRFVNSSYFGLRHEITNIKQAITLVGMRAIKNFVLYTAVFGMIPDPKCGPFELKKLWQDSLRRGLFARAMGKTLGLKEAEEPFAAALLQDMAVPLLAKEVPEAYDTLFGARSDSHCRVRLSRLEEHVFGWNHAEAAGIIARQWKLPEGFATLIEDHLTIDELVHHADSEPGKLAVAMSALLPNASDPGWAEYNQFESYYEQARPASGPPAAELLVRVDREFEDIAPVLRIAPPEISLADTYNEMAAIEAE